MFRHLCKSSNLLKNFSLSNRDGIRFKSTTVAPAIKEDLLKQTKNQISYKPGTIYNGFVCTRTQFIPDFQMTAYMFEHEKTGLEYLHIERGDSNNVFSINFRTTPFDSTGLPHILEHNVLCGSAKYPVRDPFFKMLNRSLATFMNAMTGPDYTLYPFSSTNEKDYRNLQSIYLDAVFKPNLKYLDFLQEGWRLEHAELENKDSDYIFKGVVYNEMKGAFSENASVFGQQFFNRILPKHTYGYVSGGDPLKIPDLTHFDLVSFHKKYYHPSNARMFSYGNFNLDKTLEYVNTMYLSHYDRLDPQYSVIPPQTRWEKPETAHITSRYDNMGAAMEKQNQIAIGFLMSDIKNIYETFVIYFLTELLIKGPNSYFYKSLIEPNISGGYNQMTGFDSSIRDTMFVIGLQDLQTSDFEKVQKIFDTTIDKIIDRGFDKTHMESVLHNIELQMKHQTTKFGLGLLFNLTPIWNHNGDLVKSMYVSALIKELRENLKRDPEYLQKKVRQYFKENQHKLVLTMSPDVEYEKKFQEQEARNLSVKVNRLTDKDKIRVYKDGLQLNKEQKAPVNTDILPCLKLSDIEQKREKLNIKNSIIKNVATQICVTNTNGIVYFRGILDASTLTTDQKILLPLFTSVVDQFGTKDINYRDFDKQVTLKTSGISFHCHVTENMKDITKYELGVLFGSYCLNKNAREMFKIFQNLFLNANLLDVGRFEMLLENYISTLSVGIADSGHLYAMQNCNSLVTESGKLKDQLLGIAHLNHMKQLTQMQRPHQILDTIREMADILLKEAHLRCSLNIGRESDPSLKDYENFIGVIRPGQDIGENAWNHSKLLDSSCRHNLLNIPVNYCAKSVVTVPYTHSDYAKLKILARILSSKYLLPVVREQNGAYGSGAKINSDGIFNFFSYRDPNSRKTLNTFDDTANWFRDNLNTIDDQSLFEAKLGVLQQLEVPIAPVDKGMDLFRYGLTEEMFEKHREAILNVKKSDLETVVDIYFSDDKTRTVGKCVMGPENNNLTKLDEIWTMSSN